LRCVVDERQVSEDLVSMGVLAKKQQATAQAAVDRLDLLSKALGEQLAAFNASIPTVRKAATDGVHSAIAPALAGALASAAKTLSETVEPVAARLEGAASAAGAVEAKLRRVADWLSWRLAARVGVALGIGVLVTWCLAWAVLTSREHEVRDLQALRESLTAEVEALQHQAVRLKVVECEQHSGPKGRKCLPVDISGLYGDPKANVLYYPVW